MKILEYSYTNHSVLCYNGQGIKENEYEREKETII